MGTSFCLSFFTWSNGGDRNQTRQYPDNKLQLITEAFGCKITLISIIPLSMNTQIWLSWYFWGESYLCCSPQMQSCFNCKLPWLLMSSMWEIMPLQWFSLQCKLPTLPLHQMLNFTACLSKCQRVQGRTATATPGGCPHLMTLKQVHAWCLRKDQVDQIMETKMPLNIEGD